MAYKSSPKASIFPLLTMGSGTGYPMTAKVSASYAAGRNLKYSWTSGSKMCSPYFPCLNGNDRGASLDENSSNIIFLWL